jgi:hypothetical protein
MAKNNSGGNDSGTKKQAQLSNELKKVLEEAEKIVSFEPSFDFEHSGARIILPAIQNPDDAYELYYSSLAKLKRSFIPKGKTGQPVRDEINIFLKRGKEKGADGRQSYTHLMREAINIFLKWANEYNGGNIMDLYFTFHDLNNKK